MRSCLETFSLRRLAIVAFAGLCLGLAACVPSTQRLVVTIRDSQTHLPVAGATTHIYLDQAPPNYHAQPIALPMDNLGMNHVLLVQGAAAYYFQLQAPGYADACYDLPVFDDHFPFDQWLYPRLCRHPANDPCSQACETSTMEMMISLPRR